MWRSGGLGGVFEGVSGGKSVCGGVDKLSSALVKGGREYRRVEKCGEYRAEE